jgi:GxxExxY protein
MEELICKTEVYQIIGAAMEVHSVLGCGFLEPVYQEALEIEFGRRSIPFEAQAEIRVQYKDHPLEKYYVPDFVCFGKVIVELKALEQLSSREETQLLNYLKSTGIEVGVLVNFGAESLEWKRKVLTKTYTKNLVRKIGEISG